MGNRLIWFVGKAASRFLALGLGRARVFGIHNVPLTGGVVIVSNHQSYLDPMLLSVALPRQLTYMARRSLWNNRAFGALITSLNAFPVTREGADLQALREAVARVRAGMCLVVFPEGTRTSDGRIAPLKRGVMMIAERAQAPVVPAVIDGAFEVWPRGKMIRPHPIRLMFGRSISVAEQERLGRDALTERLQSEMLNLQAQLRRTEHD